MTPAMLKDFANIFLQKWKSHRLSDWFCMLVGGIIFVVGYFLGAMSLRKGSPEWFIVIDFMSGSVGLIYCFYKGLKIVSETHEEYITMILEENSRIKNQNSKLATENAYVLGETVFNRVHKSKLQSLNNMYVNTQNLKNYDIGKRITDVSPSHSHTTVRTKEEETQEQEKYNICSEEDMIFKSYENVPITFGHAEKVKDISQEIINSPVEHVSENSTHKSFIRLATPGVQSFLKEYEEFLPDGHSAELEAEASRKFHFAIQNSRQKLGNELLSDQSNYHIAELQYLQPEEFDSNNLLENENNEEIYSMHMPLDRFKSVSEQFLCTPPENNFHPYGQQRVVQSSVSENFLPTVKNDFIQHYQRPRSVSFLFTSSNYEGVEAPDPCRHLKPSTEPRKRLPPEPDHNSAISNASSSLTGQPQSPVLTSPQLQASVAPDNNFKLLEPQTSQFQSPILQKFKSPAQLRLFQSPVIQTGSFSSSKPKVRNFEPLTRHLSHPIRLESQSPPPDVRFLTPESEVRKGNYLTRCQSNSIALGSKAQPPKHRFLSPESTVRRCESLVRHKSIPITLGSRSPPRVVQSPPPRSRPSPPFRTSNMPVPRMKLSPPSIPRKVKSPS